MKNETIIEELDITPEEMQQMSTLIDSAEKQSRNTEYQRKKRRSQGVLSREEYIKEQQAIFFSLHGLTFPLFVLSTKTLDFSSE